MMSDVMKLDDDNLQKVNGIGPTYENALHELGITRYQILVNYSADQLTALLAEKGKNVPTAKTEKWIETAVALVKENSDERPSTILSESDLNWQEFAQFTLTFEQAEDTQGQPVWQTVVYDPNYYGSEKIEDGLFSEATIQWIKERIQLFEAKPTPEKSAPSTKEKGERPLTMLDQPKLQQVTSPNLQVEIKPVQISTRDVMPNFLDKMLVADVDFSLSGALSREMTDANTPFQIEVTLTNLDTQKVHFVESPQGSLVSGEYNYSKSQLIPLPETAGEYELQVTVVILAPVELRKGVNGPDIKIVEEG